MPLPEYVVPVLAVAGPPALVFVVMRCFPHTARAVVVLLAPFSARAASSQVRGSQDPQR